jgi:hypothetical protein
MPVEAAAAKGTAAFPKCEVSAVLLAHGCLVGRHNGLFVSWCFGPLSAWCYEEGGGATDGAGAQRLHDSRV